VSDWQLSSGTVEARTEERLAAHRGDYEPPRLFDPATTKLPLCGHCNTTRKNLCRHDADVQHGLIQASARRPKACLNRIDPANDPFPDGY
jgi:hypothetical protein